MGGMRTQLSLQFSDEELYDNFIIPSKNERTLNSLIIRLLSAYYYNEEVRSLVEGTSLGDYTEGLEVQSTQSICDNIRATLVIQDYLSTELQQTIENGTEDVNNILNRTNDLATESGLAKTAESEYGSKLLQVDSRTMQITDKKQSSDGSTQSLETSAVLQILIRAISSMAEASGNAEVKAILSEGLGSATPVQPVEQQKTSSSVVAPQVSTDSAYVESDFEENSFESFEGQDDFGSSFVPVPVSEPVVEDASDAMQELLNSL